MSQRRAFICGKESEYKNKNIRRHIEANHSAMSAIVARFAEKPPGQEMD